MNKHSELLRFRAHELKEASVTFAAELMCAADEIDRLEQLIADAPHAENCTVWKPGDIDDGGPYNECSCWKSRA